MRNQKLNMNTLRDFLKKSLSEMEKQTKELSKLKSFMPNEDDDEVMEEIETLLLDLKFATKDFTREFNRFY